MKLIKTQDKFILVSDEEIQINDNYVAWETNYATEPKERWVIYNRLSELNGTNQKKIISENPDFSLLSEEECKEIGYIDVEKLALKQQDHYSNDLIAGFTKGFKTAQSLNDKMFSLEDMRKVILMGRIRVDNISPKYAINEIIQSLQQTEWDVEVEMDKIPADRAPNGWDEFPKITNGKIKVTKIL